MSPAITSLRWGAFAYGLLFAAPSAFRGSYAAVAATAICLFVTTWRTVLPVRLGVTDPSDRIVPFLDVAAFAASMAISGGWSSPYYFTALVAVVVVAFGSGAGDGAAALILTTVVVSVGGVGDVLSNQRDIAAIATLVVAVVVAVGVRRRLQDAERRGTDLTRELTQLTEANELLEMLNVAARRLPDALSLRDALDRVRQQLTGRFDARVICLLAFDDASEEWVPKIADGCALRPAYPRADLPAALAEVLGDDAVLRPQDLDPDGTATARAPGAPLRPIVRSSRSGMYVRLTARGEVVGLLGIEHPSPDRYGPQDAALLRGLADVLALTVDNARWFGRLRTLGAQEERIRIARDLHDRLGQWLTYVSMELERIVATDRPAPSDLLRLQSDVQAALDELRETLRQLRSGVTDQKPLAAVAHDVVTRFAERADVAATLTVVHPEDRMSLPVENELLRILQEALTNVDRHAHADHVDVVWDVRGGDFELVVRDDGRGFESAKGVRDSAYGLVGMRERADVIGARLSIISVPGDGTTVRVHSGPAAPEDSDLVDDRNAPAGPDAADRRGRGSGPAGPTAADGPSVRRGTDDREVTS